MIRYNKIPEKGSKKLREFRISEKERFYFITTSCFNKQRLFVTKEIVQTIFDTIEWLEKEKHIECYFVIIMPDHFHLVFQLLNKKTLSEVMKSLKGFSGTKIKKIKTLDTPVWQNQFYDHLIKDEEELFEFVEYCFYNPVRAGIVDNPKKYPHWKSKYEL